MNDLTEIKESLDASINKARRIKNSWDKKLRDNYVTKIFDGLYLFENGETKRLIERNDRCSDWDIYWTDATLKSLIVEHKILTEQGKEPHPDRYCHNEPTLRSAIMECYRDSITL